MYDLLIRNGRVYDATGAPWFQATVAVEEGRLRLLRGDTSGLPATRAIDATGPASATLPYLIANFPCILDTPNSLAFSN